MEKTFAKTVICIMIAAVLFLAALFCIPTVEVAYADDTVTVVKATVSNLTGNAYAGKSALKIYHGDDPFYVPESYFVTNPKPLTLGTLYSVEYNDTTCHIMPEDMANYLQESISIAENEVLYPDVRLHVKDNVEVVIKNQLITSDYTIKLWGYGENDDVYVCATLNGSPAYGFIKSENLEAFNVPYQQRAQAERNAILEAQKKPEITDGNITPKTSLALRIVLIIGITIPALIIVILLFKPSKDERRRSRNSVRRERADGDIDYDDPRSYRRADDRRYDDRRYADDRRYDDGRYDDRRYDSRRDDYDRDDRDYDRYRDDDRRSPRDYDDRDGYRSNR